MKDIISRYLNKIGRERKNIVFLYNGVMINEELTFNQCANRLDRSRNYMNVVVIEGQSNNEDSLNLKKSNYIICPQCKEKAILSIKDYKLSISGCKSKHKSEDLQLKELEKTQYIDQSKIYCDNCHNLKSNTFENKFFKCYQCKQNLCPNCKDSHNKEHLNYIKNYDENQFYCQFHCNEYNCYCEDCKKDLCDICQKEHENHEITFYDNIMPDLDIIRNDELKNTKEKIYKLKTIINGMIYQLNQLNKNLDNYFDIYDNIVSSIDIKKRNYYLINNINNMKKCNDYFLLNLTEVINDENLKTQFTSIINLQSKMDFKKYKKNNQITKIEQQQEKIIENIVDDNKIKK